MPTSSSSSLLYLSDQFSRRRPKSASASGEEQQGGGGRGKVKENGGGGLNGMGPKKDPKKVRNGSVAKKEKVVRYGECRKNHAASIGGYAVDGCREFMAAGEEGTSAALKCAACNCHRSFHKREVESDAPCDCSSNSTSWR